MASRRWTASSNVLLLLCLMYFITYVDRVNLSTAASAFEKELGLSKPQLGFVLLGLRLSLSGLPDHRRLVRRPFWCAVHADRLRPGLVGRDHAHRLGGRPLEPFRRPRAARALGRARPSRPRPGPCPPGCRAASPAGRKASPMRRPPRQRGHAACRCALDRLCLLARLLRHHRAYQPSLGRRLGLVLTATTRGTTAGSRPRTWRGCRRRACPLPSEGRRRGGRCCGAWPP